MKTLKIKTMKKLIILVMSILLFTSCVTTIPLQTNLSDQTMLLAENRNIKVNYVLITEISDGYIPYVSVLKDGTETINNVSYKYASETAFNRLWGSYFASKFSSYASDQIDVKITLINLKLVEQAATSIGMTILTGNTKVNMDAIGTFHVLVNYNDKLYENKFEVIASEYNESQQMKFGNTYYTANQTNPTQQKSKLLESCLNRSIIQFENYLRSIITMDSLQD